MLQLVEQGSVDEKNAENKREEVGRRDKEREVDEWLRSHLAEQEV